MKIGLWKKGFVIGIIWLFVGAGVLPSMGGIAVKKESNYPISKGNTIYVGGTGPNNYTKIQDAINDTSDGDTIFVYDDSAPYRENLVVNKSINLIGEDRNTTTIDGRRIGHVVNISADYVTFEGFTVQKSKYLHAGIELLSDNNIITDNNIIMNCYGIHCDHSYYNDIKHNNIDQNSFFGIKFEWGRYNNISYNNVTNSDDDGIRFMDSSKFNVIYNNLISSNDAGICFWNSNNNTISENNIHQNHQGIHFYKSCMNIIYKNNVTSSSSNGIHIYWDSNNNKIYLNNIIDNKKNAHDTVKNQWDDGEKGNYWSDYKSQNPFAYKIKNKGIWSKPYKIPDGSNKDRYPLIWEWPNSKPRTLVMNTPSYSYYLLRLLEHFPLLEKLLSLI